MAFESVNVSSLKNAITSCRNSINTNNLQEIIYEISNNSVWSTSSRDNLRLALDKLINQRYGELEKQLDAYVSIATMIEEYKNLEEEVKQMKNQITNLTPRMYYTESYIVTSTDIKGKRIDETCYRTVKDYSVEQQINVLSGRISNNNARMSELESKVANAI